MANMYCKANIFAFIDAKTANERLADEFLNKVLVVNLFAAFTVLAGFLLYAGASNGIFPNLFAIL